MKCYGSTNVQCYTLFNIDTGLVVAACFINENLYFMDGLLIEKAGVYES